MSSTRSSSRRMPASPILWYCSTVKRRLTSCRAFVPTGISGVALARVYSTGGLRSAVKESSPRRLAHRGADVDGKGAFGVEAHLDFVPEADLYLSLAVEGDAARPLLQFDLLPGADAAELLHPDRDHEAGGQGDC